jgi:hypothetical protein
MLHVSISDVLLLLQDFVGQKEEKAVSRRENRNSTSKSKKNREKHTRVASVRVKECSEVRVCV